MMKITHIATALLAATVFCTPAADAGPIQPFNTRPVAVNAVGGEASLQTLVNSMLGIGVDAGAGQSTAGLWAAAEFPFGILASLEFEYAGNNAINAFGMWSGADTDSVQHVPLFLGAATGVGSGTATQAAVTWNDEGLMTIAGDCLKVNCGSHAGIDPLWFGFYLQVGTGPTYYSADQLNDGVARALAFEHESEPTWAIAFEDWADGDFNDGALKIQSARAAFKGGNERVNPVPEPASLVLMGTGLTGLLLRRRSRRSLARL